MNYSKKIDKLYNNMENHYEKIKEIENTISNIRKVSPVCRINQISQCKTCPYANQCFKNSVKINSLYIDKVKEELKARKVKQIIAKYNLKQLNQR